MLKNKYFLWMFVALFGLFIFFWACQKDSVSTNNDTSDTGDLTLQQRTALAQSVNGNGIQSGPHYNLNIIGVPKEKTADMTGDNGHRIFVKLDGNTKIGLAEGDDFQVLDANGTDNNGAQFQLPNPDPDGDGVTWYSVFGRALGAPGGSATMTTCGTDTATDENYCSTLAAVFVRDKGGSHFANVSKELLFIYADLDGDGTPERYSIFDDAFYDYFWSYDNNGLKLLQLRFYEVPTDVN